MLTLLQVVVHVVQHVQDTMSVTFHNACITQSLQSLWSGDRRDRRLTGSMTVLTVLTVRVFC